VTQNNSARCSRSSKRYTVKRLTAVRSKQKADEHETREKDFTSQLGVHEFNGDTYHVIRALVWFSLSLVFGVCIGFSLGVNKAEEYFTGYILEQSLSVDNLFVFVLVFKYFQVPEENQERVLAWGIGGAVILRALVIVAGLSALEIFEPLLLVLALVLILSALNILFEGDDESTDLSQNYVVQLCRNSMKFSESYDGDRFFTLEDGISKGTPLLIALIVIELSDIIFAVDSIPAIFGVTKDPLLVYASNLFAIVGLRSLFSVLSTAVLEFAYLQTTVACILIFVGAKMIADYFGLHLSPVVSLGVIVTMLSSGIVASIVAPAKDAD